MSAQPHLINPTFLDLGLVEMAKIVETLFHLFSALPQVLVCHYDVCAELYRGEMLLAVDWKASGGDQIVACFAGYRLSRKLQMKYQTGRKF